MSKKISWPSRQYTWPFLKLNTVHGEGFGLTKPTNPMLIEPSKCGLFTANRFADLIHVICRKGCVRHRAHLPISHIQHFSPLNSGLHVRIPGAWASDSENVMAETWTRQGRYLNQNNWNGVSCIVLEEQERHNSPS